MDKKEARNLKRIEKSKINTNSGKSNQFLNSQRILVLNLVQSTKTVK